MNPIAIFYHTLFQIGNEMSPVACEVVREQVETMTATGLVDAASEIIIGVNGDEESGMLGSVIFPEKARMVLHGLQCRNECRTIAEMEKWLTTHPDWHVLYLHTKGATNHCELNVRWRRCMMRGCVSRWQECVNSLERGYEAVGVHWAPHMGVHLDQHYFAGTFFWATSNFLRTLPSIYERARIKESGIDSVESRYEAEVWIGNGPRLPKIRDMDKSHGIMRCP